MLLVLLYMMGIPTGAAIAKPSVVTIRETAGKYQLYVDGAPFFIKGAGGDASKSLLKEIGGNSYRTWGADNLGAALDEAQKLGLMVTVGIWLGHQEQGFNYNSADQVAAQYEMVRQVILKYRDYPAVLMWGVGNEMEGYGKGDNAAIWSAVNNIAALVKKLDPNHPVMTIIAEIGGDRVKNINRLCPDIDVIGINSYAGVTSIPQRYKQAGGIKPYVITEFGPPGVWELPKDNIGAVDEPTSTAKGEIYKTAWDKAIANQNLCLGGYAFTWGSKQEATSTWFGMLLPDGSRLAAADAMQQLWSGKPPAHPCPVIKSFTLDHSDEVDPGVIVHAKLDVSSPSGGALKVQWILQKDMQSYNTNGATEKAPPAYPDAFIKSNDKQAEIKLPSGGGIYRIFVFVRDAFGGAATANLPIKVKGAVVAPAETAPVTKLPLVLYDEPGRQGLPYTPSGYMGNTGAIKIVDSTDNPHSGKYCMQCSFDAADGWGGVYWQDPPNDWGDQPGGHDLTGARELSFWARGAKGGESVTFLYGGIGKDKPYYDTASDKLQVTLTDLWKEYHFDLAGKDLKRIKFGFGWVATGSASQTVFFLDDIQYR
jgi:hypothetical protein